MKKIIFTAGFLVSAICFAQGNQELTQVEGSPKSVAAVLMTQSELNKSISNTKNESKSDLDNEFDGNRSQRKRLETKLTKLLDKKKKQETSQDKAKISELDKEIADTKLKIQKNQEELERIQQRYRENKQ